METPELLSQWRNGLRIAHMAHSRARTRCVQYGRLLGAPAAILSAVVGSALFATLGKSEDTRYQFAAAVVSMVVAVLSALQGFLRYPELAEKHGRAAEQYGRLRRRLEQAMTALPEDPAELQALLQSVREEWDVLDRESPSLPQAMVDTATKIVKPPGTTGKPGPGAGGPTTPAP